jgi:hypothetical protein
MLLYLELSFGTMFSGLHEMEEQRRILTKCIKEI